MDPASVLGLIAETHQPLGAVYSVGLGVCEAKDETNQLCSEHLVHIQFNIDAKSVGAAKDAQVVLVSYNFNIPGFKEMILSIEDILKGLMARLDRSYGKFKSGLQR